MHVQEFVRLYSTGMASTPQLPATRRPIMRRPAPVRPDRRQAILLAAEKLFALRGYHAVTIRQIAEEAGVPLALVGYYFGQKHELFHAIFEDWRHTIDERLALLRQARASAAEGDALRRIVAAFVEPVLQIRASAEGESYALLVARELAYRTPEAERVLADFFDPMAHAFIDELHRACPGNPRAQAAWAYQFALGALIHHISDHRVQRLSRGRNAPNDARAGALLIDFVTAGIAAILQPEASRSPPLDKTRRRP
jgi:AcrR family transcriptional regulator